MKKKILLAIISIILVSLFTATAYARELYYNGNTPIVLKWNTKSGAKLYLTCSDDYFTGGTVYQYYSAGIAIWPTGCPTTVSTADTSFSSAKVDYVRPTTAYWDSIWGDPFTQFINTGVVTFAYTNIWDTNGTQITSVGTAQSSTKLIGSASVYVNPYDSAWNWTVVAAPSTDRIKAILAHELGHVMGMGHSDGSPFPSSSASIMKTDAFSISTSPQSYDKTEVSNHIP